MQIVVRAYSGKGAKEFFDVLVSYTLARTADGGYSVTICKDKAGIDESVKKAKEWIVKNAGKTGAGAPKVSDGTVIIHAIHAT